MKNLERATIIGETTGGGAHPVTRKTFKNIRTTVSVPYGRAINPITGTNWEEVGIKPHIEVPKEEALDVAIIEATKKLVEKETDEKKKANLTWYLENMEVLRNPFIVSEDLLKKYAGKYGPRNVIYENGILFYQREDRPKYKLIPINDDTFILDGLDYFRLQFVRDESGEISMVKGIYINGRVDISERD